MAFIGKEIFTEYKKAKSKFADFDTWIAESIREEYGPEFVAPLMAAKICKTTRLPWENVEVFENVALVLNGREALPGIDQEISIKEIAFAVATLKQEFPDDEFNDFICQYFAAEAGEGLRCSGQTYRTALGQFQSAALRAGVLIGGGRRAWKYPRRCHRGRQVLGRYGSEGIEMSFYFACGRDGDFPPPGGLLSRGGK